MARGGAEMRNLARMVPVTGASSFVQSSTKVTAQSVAWFALVHAAVALVVFLVLGGQTEEHFNQCMEACPVLTVVEFCSTLFFHHIIHLTMTVSTVLQMLAAALALVSTGWPRRAATFVALCIAVATGMLSTRLVYTALFGSHCCFTGGFVQVASAVAVVLCQASIPFWGGLVASELAHAHAHLP